MSVCPFLQEWHHWVCVGISGSCCLQGASLGALPLCGRRSPPALCSGQAVSWWSRCITHVSLVGDRQEFPGSCPGIPPPSGLGELQAVLQPRVCLQGLRAPLSDSQWPPMSPVWDSNGAAPGTVPGDGYGPCGDGFLCQMPEVRMLSCSRFLPPFGTRNGGAAGGDSKHGSWCGLRGIFPVSNLCNTSFLSISTKHSSFELTGYLCCIQERAWVALGGAKPGDPCWELALRATSPGLCLHTEHRARPGELCATDASRVGRWSLQCWL